MPGAILLYSRSMPAASLCLAAAHGLGPAPSAGPPQATPAPQEFHAADARTLPSPDGSRRLRIRRGIATLEGDGLRPPRRVARIRHSGSLLWAPDGGAFALNLVIGSNLAEAGLFDAGTGRRLADLGATLDRAHPEDVWAGHRYVRVTGWSDTRTVDVVVEGHADSWGMAFEMRYRYTLGKGLVRLSRKCEGRRDDGLKLFTEACPKG